ncbi:PREDICTED: trypsin-1-like [Nicrophorus vespilloides]|uniref:Trypsin-1-like n=1 Tax=Nicrophorus vespilloides TaxID=110193 RepID=A0ABM1N329_NICVS|nr:PREDICTED: trypsin-1-like [Nicrophorus vespilloides]
MIHRAVVFLLVAVVTANAFNNFADIECGRASRKQPKIVGGGDALPGEFPWLVSITRRGGHFCGGSLITNRHVLTAAHCICSGVGNDILKPASIKVSLGQYDLRKESDAYEMTVSTITAHPEYKCNKVKSDIAILKLDQPISWTSKVLPACLPLGSDDLAYRKYENILATVAGWGWTNENSSKGGRANILQKAKVNVLENERCRQWYKSQGKKTKIQETQMCAGHEQGGVDSCWADSGGPLMVDQSSQTMVIGVVSTGIGCARPYLPGIYTRVSDFIPWIQSQLGN